MVSNAPEASLKLEVGAGCGMVAGELERDGVWPAGRGTWAREEQSQRKEGNRLTVGR